MPMKTITSTLHENSRYGWMMTYLLTVDWTAIYERLVGLPQNRIEGLVHFNVYNRGRYGKGYNFLEPLKRIALWRCSLFQEQRRVPVGAAQSWQIRIVTKGVYWKRYRQYVFAAQYVSAQLLEHALQNIVLCLNLLLVRVDQLSFGVYYPLFLPVKMLATSDRSNKLCRCFSVWIDWVSES